MFPIYVFSSSHNFANSKPLSLVMLLNIFCGSFNLFNVFFNVPFTMDAFLLFNFKISSIRLFLSVMVINDGSSLFFFGITVSISQFPNVFLVSISYGLSSILFPSFLFTLKGKSIDFIPIRPIST